jgi:hypothetical protein
MTAFLIISVVIGIVLAIRDKRTLAEVIEDILRQK